MWGSYKSGVLTGKGSAELDDLDETTLDGDFVNGRLHGRVKFDRENNRSNGIGKTPLAKMLFNYH